MSDLIYKLRAESRRCVNEDFAGLMRDAAQGLEEQSKIIDELVEAGASAAQRLRYCGDLWYDQGLESRAEADWEASDRLNLLISKAQAHKPNEGQKDE